MDLLWFALRRLGSGLLLLFAVCTATFFGTQGLPGDTARAILGQNSSPEQLAALRAQLGLNKSVWAQYTDWLTHIGTFRLGSSYTSGLPVSEILGQRLQASLWIAVCGAVIGLSLAILTALYSALHRGSLIDRIALKGGVLLAAIPDFVLAILLILVFATGLMHILPATSLIDPQSSLLGQWRLTIMPSVVLGLIMTPHTMYMLRATISDEMDSEYANYARLNGMSEWRVMISQVLPNAILPAAQVIALGLAYLIGGVVSVEVVFAFPGLGSALVDAVQTRDLAVVQAITIFATAAFLLLTFVADLVGYLATPKERAIV